MDCPAENSAFTDRTGTTSSMASQAAALRQAEPVSTDESTVANAAMAMDAALREELAALIEAEAELALDVQATQPAPQVVGDTGEVNDTVQDEGPLDALIEFENSNTDGPDEGIPQEVLDAPVNLAATTGEQPAKKAEEPDQPVKKDAGEEAKADPATPNDPAETKAAEAAATGTTTDADAVPEDDTAIDTTGMTPGEILAAAAAAANADAGGDGTEAAAEGEAAPTDAVDMGAGTAMTADMCPMQAAEMMAGETVTAMADMAAGMTAETDMMSEDMTADDM